MLPQDQITKSIKTFIDERMGSSTDLKNVSADLSLPVYSKHGDFTTNVALRLAKLNPPQSTTTPQEGNPNIDKPLDIAKDIVEHLKNDNEVKDLIKDIEIAGPGLINIFLSNDANKILLQAILKDEEVFKLNTDRGLHWVIEHTSPNPNKAMHLGHLRNNLVGMSLANLIEQCGAHVTRDCVDNNRGIAIAKAMYGFLALKKKDAEVENEAHPTLDKGGAGGGTQNWINNKDAWYTPQDLNMRPDVFVSECYVGCCDLIKENPEIDDVIRKMVIDWENKDKDTWALWQHILDYSYAGMNMTLARLGNKWDYIWHEHEHYQAGKDYVEQGLSKGIFKKLDDGAVLTQIEEKYNIPETILLKSDGTALYITQDIALTDLKKKKYNADKLVWVIGPVQSLAMQQMFAVCEQLGIGKLSDFIHIPYGYMGLKDEDGNFKKMASRDGTVLLIDDLLDTIKSKINEVIGDRLQVTEEKDLTEKIALAAVKFSILKVEKNMNMAFDINESINIAGDSGVYILYTLARIKSLSRETIKKNIDFLPDDSSESFRETNISGDIAGDVIRKLHGYKIILNDARKHLSVHPIAHYLLELASVFNSWYAVEKILDDTPDMPEKLLILKSIETTIENALSILGIQSVEKM